MKNLICLVIFLGIFTFGLNAQHELQNLDLNKTYIFTTHDGATFVGKLKSFDSKEVNIATIKIGDVSVPKYQIKEIKEARIGDFTEDGELLKDNLFATRYFLTTNGFPIKKGDAYVQVNWYGPDVQYGISDRLSVGLMTTWMGTPIVGNVKYSFEIDDNLSIGLGGLVGTLGWSNFKTGGALPYASLTLGDRKTNFTVSGGYGAIWFDDYDGMSAGGEALASVAGMTRISNSLTFVFDSFVIPGLANNTPFTALLIPGLRFQRKESFALQLGVAGLYLSDTFDGTGFFPVPIPMFQVYWKF